MNREILEAKCKIYKKIEGRASYYDLALEIVDEHPVHASVILLATWNVSRFRFMASDSKNLHELIEAFRNCEQIFRDLKNFDLQTIDFELVKSGIITLYGTFSKIKGVEYTGTSKVLHLMNRHLFVMWDSYIRKGYDIRSNTAADYFNFLKKMQSEFGSIEWNNPTKTLAKAIDEYNYVVFTYPALQKKRKK